MGPRGRRAGCEPSALLEQNLPVACSVLAAVGSQQLAEGTGQAFSSGIDYRPYGGPAVLPVRAERELGLARPSAQGGQQGGPGVGPSGYLAKE